MKREFNYSLITNLEDNDLNDLINLFHEVVHSVNTDDYTKTQFDAWACKNPRVFGVDNLSTDF